MKGIAAFVGLVLTCAVTTGQGLSTYRGKQYRVNANGRICNSASCQMCAVLQQRYFANTPRRTLGIAPRADEVAEVVKAVEREWLPMPADDLPALMQIVKPQPGKNVLDLGCGDGRILKAARNDGANVVGVEINKSTAKLAATNLARFDAGWKIVVGDATTYTLKGADVVTCYLFPDTLKRMRWDTLDAGAVVVSYQHDIPGLQTKPIRVSGCVFYVHHAN